MCDEVALRVGAGPGCVAASWGVPAVVGNTAGPAPPPAAESRTSWSMFQPVQAVGTLAHGGLWPAVVWTTCGPAPSVIPLASGPHGTTCDLTVGERVRGRSDDGDGDRPAVDRQQVGDTGSGEVGGRRCGHHAGDADLGDAERQRQLPGRVVVRRVLGPDGGEREDEVRAGERPGRTRAPSSLRRGRCRRRSAAGRRCAPGSRT